MERILGFLFIGLLPLSLVLAQEEYKVVRATPTTEEQLRFLKSLEDNGNDIDFWKSPSRVNRPVDMSISTEDYARLSKLFNAIGGAFTILINDVEKAVAAENIPKGRSSSFHSKYHTLDEIHSELDKYQQKSFAARIINDIGTSYEGRNQKAIHFYGASKPNKPIFFLQCGIHAREWVSPASCMYIADQIATHYNYDRDITRMLDKMDFIILPVVNVDGYAYTWRGKSRRYRLWRKTRSRNPGSSCIGTDPNRNWDYKWGYSGTSSDPCSIVYKGSKPFSEKETDNVRKYVIKLNGRVKGFIDTHSYSQMWFVPWGYSAKDTPDHAEQMRVAKAAVDAIYYSGGTHYDHGSAAALLWPAAGGTEDYTYSKLGIKYSFGTELRDTGHYGFLLPADQILPTAREYLEGIKAAVREMKV